MTDTKQFTLSKIDTERAVVTYLNLATKNKGMGFEKFSSHWNNLFSIKGYKNSIKLKRKAFREAQDILGDKSIEEIQTYRDDICIFKGSKVPDSVSRTEKGL